jgi:cytochrome c553
MKTAKTRFAILLFGCFGSIAADAAPSERADRLIMHALQLDADRGRGEGIYRANCMSCHGNDGFGDASRNIPALAAQRRAYVVKQLVDFVEGERIAKQMHRVLSRKAVKDPQVWADVALYVNGLPAPTQTEVGDGQFLEIGEASYEQFCSSCHESDGRGDDDGFVPSLRNQHYSYLLKEMRHLAAGHRFNVEDDLRRFLGSLQMDEMRGLADYLSRMRGAVQDRTRLNDDGTVSD